MKKRAAPSGSAGSGSGDSGEAKKPRAQKKVLDESFIDTLSPRQQNALLHDLYKRHNAIRPKGAAQALATAAGEKSAQQKLNRKLSAGKGYWEIEDDEGLVVGCATFAAAGSSITLTQLEVGDVDSSGYFGSNASSEDHLESLEFKIGGKICGQSYDATFTVNVESATEIYADLDVDETGDDEPLSQSDLKLVYVH